MLRGAGYEHVAFNALHGTERLLFFDSEGRREAATVAAELLVEPTMARLRGVAPAAAR